MTSAPRLPVTATTPTSTEFPQRVCSPPLRALKCGCSAWRDAYRAPSVGDHDVIKTLIRARNLGLEPGKLGLHFSDLTNKLHVIVHYAFSLFLIHSNRFPLLRARTRCVKQPVHREKPQLRRGDEASHPLHQGGQMKLISTEIYDPILAQRPNHDGTGQADENAHLLERNRG